MEKLTNDQLAKATDAILKAGRYKALISGTFGTTTGTRGCALGHTARSDRAENFFSWLWRYFSVHEVGIMFATNDDMIRAGVPQEVVAETMAAIITEIHRSS